MKKMKLRNRQSVRPFVTGGDCGDGALVRVIVLGLALRNFRDSGGDGDDDGGGDGDDAASH
jgi:hypothetical protein